ncbi:recombinase family protein [Cyanobacterium aponinum UTEX 3222]|nr:recombinase family protein [Cyanobacterium aponinum UTEX 3222]
MLKYIIYSGKSYQKIVDCLNAQSIPTKQGKELSFNVVYRICQDKAS